MKDKTRRRLMAMLMAVVMLGGVLAARSPVEARTEIEKTWKIIGEGAKHEIVKIYNTIDQITECSRYRYLRVLSLEEAIERGATEAYRITDTNDSLSYATIIAATGNSGEKLYDTIYAPIRVSSVVNDGAGCFVIDNDGNKLKCNTSCTAKIHPYELGCCIQGGTRTTKQVAAQKVFGIKGYTKRTVKPALNAMVGYLGNSQDDRHFLYTETFKTKGISSIFKPYEPRIYPELEPLVPGETKELCVEVTNSAKTKDATGVRLYFSKIPSTMKKGEILKFTAKLTGNNVMQSPIKNTIEFVATDDIRIKKVYCSGRFDVCTSHFWTRADSKKFFTNVFSKQGALIGYRVDVGYVGTHPENNRFNGIIAPYGTGTSNTSGFWNEHLTLEIEKLK